MASNDRFLWAISYAIGDKCYTCPLYFKDREHAEGQIFTILKYAGHIRFISMEECTEGSTWGETHFPYREEKRELY